MKKFIAFTQCGTANTSTIGTLQEVRNWAKNQFTNNNTKLSKIYIAEVLEIAEREAQPIRISPYVVEHTFSEIEEAA